MSLTTIAASKDQELTYQPLLLATFRFGDGSILRLSTHPLNTAEGGVQYGGHDWFGRIGSQDIQAVQAMDERGIDRIPQVTLHLSDADKWLWLNYEMNVNRGFKGAAIQLDFVFYDLRTGTFSSDVDTKFVGICEAPQSDTEALVVSAQARTNTQQTFLPPVRIQSRCPWIFPGDSASQAESVNADSQFYECGYNPNRGQGNPGFTHCGYTKADCEERGMYALGRFGGITFTPPRNWRSKSYEQNKTIEGTNSVNDAKWNESYPLLYGTTWVLPPIMNVIGDGNSTRMEAVLCAAQLQGTRGWDPGSVLKVIVNDTEVPFVAYSPDKPIFRWDWVNPGNRNGSPCQDNGYDGKGDPYGSLACIEVVVPNRVAQSSGPPKLEVLLRGPQLHKFAAVASVSVSGEVATVTLAGQNTEIGSNDPNYEIHISGCAVAGLNGSWRGLTNFTSTSIQFNCPGVANGSGSGGFVGFKATTDNPSWVLLDLLTWSNFTFDDVDLQSFIDAATVCDAQISYIDASGATTNVDADGAPHKRFRVSMAVRDRTSAADVIRGVRLGFRAYLDWVAGKLRVAVKQTLAEQQPAPIPGSNYVTAVASVDASGNAKTGYVAYHFNGGSIRRDESGRSSLKVTRTQNTSSPNRISFAFQDRDNQYQQDALNEVDSADIARSTCEYDSSISVYGPNTFDQAMRIAATYIGEIHRGNPAFDTRGTIHIEFDTTFRAEHLRAGQIILVSDAQHGLSLQPFRVTKIGATTNYEGIRVTASWHDDRLYVDTYGQGRAQQSSSLQRDTVTRMPFPWGPNAEQPPAGDAVYDPSDLTFRVATDYSQKAADGTALVTLSISGAMPVNVFQTLQSPSIVNQAKVDGSGGSLSGERSYYLAVCAKDANGKLSAPSIFARADIPSAGAAYRVTISTPAWDDDATGYSLFAGKDPRKLTWQKDGSDTPATITLSSYKVSSWGIPDMAVQKIRAKVKNIVHAGVFSAALSGAGAGTMTIAGAGWTDNQWSGRVCSVIGKNNNGAIPRANFHVTANTSDVLTVTPDPASLGIVTGDVVVLRSKPTVSGNTLTDSLWVNSLSGGGLVPHAEKGNYYRIIAGTGKGQVSKIVDNDSTSITVEGFGTDLDETSMGIIEGPMWQTESDSQVITNYDPAATVTLNVPVENYSGQPLLVGAFTVSPSGSESDESISPMREVFIAGASTPTVQVSGDVTLAPVQQNVNVDASAGPVTVTIPKFAKWLGLNITVAKVDASENAVNWQTLEGDFFVGFGTFGVIDNQGTALTFTATQA